MLIDRNNVSRGGELKLLLVLPKGRGNMQLILAQSTCYLNQIRQQEENNWFLLDRAWR